MVSNVSATAARRVMTRHSVPIPLFPWDARSRLSALAILRRLAIPPGARLYPRRRSYLANGAPRGVLSSIRKNVTIDRRLRTKVPTTVALVRGVYTISGV